MTIELHLHLNPEDAETPVRLIRKIKENLKAPELFTGYRILHKSIDARNRNILVNLKLMVFVGEQFQARAVPEFHFKRTKKNEEVIIIGAGPAGLFAALTLLEHGIKPIIIERGKMVRQRRRDIALLNRKGIVNPNSNYCFGEGGAGTYSDGKLFTRSTKKGNVKRILELFVYHGAGEEILYESHPHIGTNKLPNIIERIRETILSKGGEFYFESCLTDLKLDAGQIKGVVTRHVVTKEELEMPARHLILATGHSARDIYFMLHQKNILLEPKPFAMGVRVEHRQELIDSIQYHCRTPIEVKDKRKYLPAAAYSQVHQSKGRGVFSFCMCPGGIIAPCATAQEEVVLNGWSPSKRNNPFANSGMVVGIETVDLIPYAKHGNLAGLYYQMAMERMAYIEGGKTQSAPAQRLVDFVKGKLSAHLPESSYQPGIVSVPLHEVLPLSISERLLEALLVFGKKMPGYLTNDAVVHGVESRTSSPVRIPRNKETFEHPQIKGLFPVGEGAGYAGGIMSAAIDGQLCATSIAGLLLGN